MFSNNFRIYNIDLSLHFMLYLGLATLACTPRSSKNFGVISNLLGAAPLLSPSAVPVPQKHLVSDQN